MPIIRTWFIGPTNHRGARIKAAADSATAGKKVSATLPWGYVLNPFRNHLKAAIALAERQGWAGEWRVLPDTDGGSLFIRTSEMHDAFKVDPVDG